MVSSRDTFVTVAKVPHRLTKRSGMHRNRLPFQIRLQLRKRTMPTVELTKENFESTITDNDTVIVDFWAEWCGPCKVFGPTFEEASEKHDDIVFGKVYTEAQPELAGFFNVKSIPTLMVFRENVVLYSQAGALPDDIFSNLISQIKEVDMEDVHRQVAAAQEAESAEGAEHDHDHADQ